MQNHINDLNKLYKEPLIGTLLKKLYSKPAPSKTLNDITFKRLLELESKNRVDHTALWIGAIIADLFISEARKANDLKLHLPLAKEFADNFIKENGFKEKESEIILEIIGTHHGGEQIYLESKLFKIADCHKFLEPAGLIDLISDYYKIEGKSLIESLELAQNKLNEKYSLIQKIKTLDGDFDIESHFQTSQDFLKRAHTLAASLE